VVRTENTELSVHVGRRRWRCVLDPHLCLTRIGAAFGCELVHHAQVWISAGALNIFDDWMLLEEEPASLMWTAEGIPDAEELRDALRTWRRFRDSHGHFGGSLCWVRDAVRESSLPEDADELLVPRWEVMAESLDQRLAHAEEHHGPMVAATRDAAALATLVPSAILLGLGCRHGDPPLCHYLKSWDLHCRRLDFFDDLVVLERNLLLKTLVEAGLSRFLWGGLRLVVVHILAPGNRRLAVGHDFPGGGDDGDFLESEQPRPIRGPWEDAYAFWYDLIAEDDHAKRE
jgi:hypothetical protein